MVLTRAQRRRLREQSNAEVMAERQDLSEMANEEKEWSSNEDDQSNDADTSDDDANDSRSLIGSPYAQAFRAKVHESLEHVSETAVTRRDGNDEITDVNKRRITLNPSDLDNDHNMFLLTNQLLSRPMEFIAPPVSKDTAWDIRQQLRRTVFGQTSSSFSKNAYHFQSQRQSNNATKNFPLYYNGDNYDDSTMQDDEEEEGEQESYLSEETPFSKPIISPLLQYENEEKKSSLSFMIFLTLILTALLFASPRIERFVQSDSAKIINDQCFRPVWSSMIIIMEDMNNTINNINKEKNNNNSDDDVNESDNDHNPGGMNVMMNALSKCSNTLSKEMNTCMDSLFIYLTSMTKDVYEWVTPMINDQFQSFKQYLNSPV